MIDADAVAAAVPLAHQRIARYARRTPVQRSPWLSETTGADVWLKLENFQVTGSFKVRGALHRVLEAAPEERAAGFVAASTGNHGLAVAHAAGVVDAPAIVYVPVNANEDKVARLEAAGVEVRAHGDDAVVAERAARAFGEESGRIYISPYNDPSVIAGQGTVGLELEEQVSGLDAVFVALGGGGLLSGAAAILKSRRPGIEVVAASPAASAVMIESLHAGEILDLPSSETLSDGTAGGVEEGSITFPLCRELIDRRYTVDEKARSGRRSPTSCSAIR